MDSALVEILKKSRRVLVLTGAGASAESGIPTFRDQLTGLWEKFDAAELANDEAFQRDPALVWGWYEWRRALVMRSKPNPAHLALAELAKHQPELVLVTQNVDDLHERAGSPSVLHLHGELLKPRCEKCARPYRFPLGIPEMPVEGARIDPPRCPECLWNIRPGVVWFGESLPGDAWNAAVDAASRCDLFLCVGTSARVQPAASLGMRAGKAGAVTVQVNPNPTDFDEEVEFCVRAPAGVALPQMVGAMVALNPR